MSDSHIDPLDEYEADFTDGPTGEPARIADSNRRTAVAGKLEKAAERVAAGGERAASLANTTADKLGETARYVRDHDSKDMMADLQDFARKHPGKSLITVAVLGFLAGRALRAR
jgi:ElaB/YqjD/DUF883 family membrane-anchored ribosome-binding protein